MAKKPARRGGPKGDRCINPDCPTRGKAYVRGLCEPCYRSLLRLLKKQNRSLSDAEQKGLCKRPQPTIGGKRFPLEAVKG